MMDPKMKIFLIIFGIIWIAGIFWALILIFNQITRKHKFISALKRDGFKNIISRGDLTDNFLNLFFKILFGDTEAKNYCELSVKKSKIDIIFETKEHSGVNLSFGLRNNIKFIKRAITIKEPLFNETLKSYFFYSIDRITHLEYGRQRKTETYNKWNFIFLFPENEKIPHITIKKQFTGSAAILMNIAKRFTSIGDFELKNTLPEFKKNYIVYGDMTRDLYLDEEFQRKLIKYGNCFPEDTTIMFNSNSITINSNIWPKNATGFVECLTKMINENTQI